MSIVIAFVLTLLGSLGVCGFFHLRGMIRDAAEEQAVDSATVVAQLQANREAIASLQSAVTSLRLQVHTLGTQIDSLNERVHTHLEEALVGPVSIRGQDVPAMLAAAGELAPPPCSGRSARRK